MKFIVESIQPRLNRYFYSRSIPCFSVCNWDIGIITQLPNWKELVTLDEFITYVSIDCLHGDQACSAEWLLWFQKDLNSTVFSTFLLNIHGSERGKIKTELFYDVSRIFLESGCLLDYSMESRACDETICKLPQELYSVYYSAIYDARKNINWVATQRNEDITTLIQDFGFLFPLVLIQVILSFMDPKDIIRKTEWTHF